MPTEGERLTGAERKALREALVAAFKGDALEQFLREELDKSLYDFVQLGAQSDVVFRLIDAAESEGWGRDLIWAASVARPRSLPLARLAGRQVPQQLERELAQVGSRVEEVRGQLDEVRRAQHQLAHELKRDTLARRVESYANLWARTEVTALYSGDPFGTAQAQALQKSLSAWYFSPAGGMFLTAGLRAYYFALQSLVRFAAESPGWVCDRPRPTDAETKALFAELLAAVAGGDDARQEDLARSQSEPLKLNSNVWKAACDEMPHHLTPSAATPAVGRMMFAAIQQVASVMRTHLAEEVRSRDELKWDEQL